MQRIFLFLLLVVVLHGIYYYPQLPEQVASHFDARGEPNDWMPRGIFFGVYWGMAGVVALTFLGLPLLLERLPDKLINLPRKDYWLAPERRAETVAYMRREFLWPGCATLIFVIGVFHLAIEANLAATPRLSRWAAWLIVGYVAFMLLWAGRLLFHFWKKP